MVLSVLSYSTTEHRCSELSYNHLLNLARVIFHSKQSITTMIIHPLDTSHTQTKLYLLLNHISEGAALLENCMLCV